MRQVVDLVVLHSSRLVLVGTVQTVLLGQVRTVDQLWVEGARLVPTGPQAVHPTVRQVLGPPAAGHKSSKNLLVVALEVCRLSEGGGGGQQPLELAPGATGGGSNGTTEPRSSRTDPYLGSPQ
ncbi:uncharacterized protein LOC124169669 [Ischnura elegans]|uniref:uncharacterized protein LOC124169669 n=1 Tax=Ischnura elegans TaxID=197161 RepID=UPI001ED86BA6|nr:uncharacterized protein LOC124169669 [Ischnura elegans]